MATPRCPDVAELVAVGRGAGLDAVGVAPADPFVSTRHDLERRKARGLHGGMNFTYRNPERSTDPGRAVADARALVVGARSYLLGRPSGEQSRPQGRVARYAWTDHYRPLREALGAVAQVLQDHGWRARVVADDNALVDREAARRAGLGWYGKNANLLLPGTGSWFVLGSVITDAPLPTADPTDLPPDGCRSCTHCLEACPTGAIVAPGVVDARRCLAWLLQADGVFPREYRVALGDRIYGCDDCQEVCPPNRRVQRLGISGAHDVADLEARVDILEVLELSDDELLDRYGRWYIPKREPRYLRRNALVVLGNTADPQDPQVEHALRRALDDEDPLIRAHAVWAARRLGLDQLLAAVYADPDPVVQEEMLTS